MCRKQRGLHIIVENFEYSAATYHELFQTARFG